MSIKTNMTSKEKDHVVVLDDNQGSVVMLYPSFLNKEAADRVFENMQQPDNIGIEYQFELPIFIHGRQCFQRRGVGFFTRTLGVESYKYSGNSGLKTQFTPDIMDSVMQEVNRSIGTEFNAILVNVYRTGRDYVGMHSDDEAALSEGGFVASVSLGASREFLLQNKADASRKVSCTVNHGDLLVMQGKTQRLWKHGVPVQASCDKMRISLTFRKHRVRPSLLASTSGEKRTVEISGDDDKDDDAGEPDVKKPKKNVKKQTEWITSATVLLNNY